MLKDISQDTSLDVNVIREYLEETVYSLDHRITIEWNEDTQSGLWECVLIPRNWHISDLRIWISNFEVKSLFSQSNDKIVFEWRAYPGERLRKDINGSEVSISLADPNFSSKLVLAIKSVLDNRSQ